MFGVASDGAFFAMAEATRLGSSLDGAVMPKPAHLTADEFFARVRERLTLTRPQGCPIPT